MDREQITFSSLEASATLDDFLSGAPFREFGQYFQGEPGQIESKPDQEATPAAARDSATGREADQEAGVAQDSPPDPAPDEQSSSTQETRPSAGSSVSGEEGSDSGPMFSRSSTRPDTTEGLTTNKEVGTVLPIDTVRATVSDIADRLKIDRGRIRVVPTESSLPKAIRDAAAEQGATGELQAVQHGDKIYVVADRMTSVAHIDESILHEAAHLGGRILYGKDRVKHYQKLFGQLGGIRGIREKASQLGFDLEQYIETANSLYDSGSITGGQRAAFIVDEFVAHANGQRAYETLGQKAARAIREFIGAAREWLREHGFNGVSEYTDSDLANLLRSVSRAAQEPVQDVNIRTGAGQSLEAGGFSDTLYRFAELGDEVVDLSQTVADASAMMGFESPFDVEMFSDMPSRTPMRFSLDDRIVQVNPKLPMTRGQAAEYMVEEIWHGIDSVRPNRTVSASSPLLDMKNGSIYKEAESHFDSEGVLAEFLVYPMAPPYQQELTPDRIKGELFARLGVLYLGNPRLMQRHLPTAYEVYHGIVGRTENPVTRESVYDTRWSRERGEIRGQYRPGLEVSSNDRGRESQGRGRGQLDGEGLGRIRRAVAHAIGGSPSGQIAYLSSRGLNAEPATPQDPSTDTPSFSRAPSTNSEAFKRWFGDSKVVDERGDPLTVYHGTGQEFTEFSADKRGLNFSDGASQNGFFFSQSRDDADFFAGKAGGDRLVQAYVRIENPYIIDNEVLSESESQWLSDLERSDPDQHEFQVETKQYQNSADINPGLERAIIDGLDSFQHDGVIVDLEGDFADRWFIVEDGKQIKSATNNRGTFDPEDPNIMFSRAQPVAESFLDRAGRFVDERIPRGEVMPDAWTDAQKQAASKFDTFTPKRPMSKAFDRIRGRALDRATQLIVDQFRPLKSLSEKAFMQAHLSKATDGAMEAVARYGIPVLRDGAIAINRKGNGFVGDLVKLGSIQEARQFMMWVAGNRADKLAAEGRENLFTSDDIEAMKRFNQGRLEDGRSRAAAYAEALRDLNAYQKAVLDIAEEAGLVDPESRETWESEFYVPFYRVLEDGKSAYGHGETGLVRQDVIRKLKGGTENLGDPLENTLSNWHSILSASMKNMASNNALDQAVEMNLAVEADVPGKNTIWTMRDGKKTHWQVDDHMIMDALSALNFNGYNNPAMRTAGAFKRALTIGVTISPAFRVRNLIRDTLQAVGTADVSYNPLKNAIDGWKMTKSDSDTSVQLMASGGAIRFGSFNDGQQRQSAERLLSMGVQENQILDTPTKFKNAFRRLYDGYQELGDRAETVNRATIYDRALSETGSHLEAAFAARDLMNFTSMGSSAAIRALAQVLPFFNARIQGMDRLVRGAKTDPRRFWAVTGTIAMASALLYMIQSDDEEYKALPDYVRDTYWPIKVGGHWLYIPKPFEIGSMGTVVERFTELMFAGDDFQGKDFRDSMVGVLTGTLAMNPIPQLVRPAAEAWFNYDMFRMRAIDGMGDERLLPEDRYTANTSAGAVQLGRAFGASPQKIEHLMRGYFGWLGTQALNVSDHLIRSVSDMPASPRRDMTLPNNWFVAGEFVKKSGTSSSKYVERFYNIQRELDSVYASANAARRSRDTDRATELMSRPEMRSRPAIAAANRQMTSINQQMRRVTADRNLSASDKNARLMELRRRRDQVARRATERVRQQ